MSNATVKCGECQREQEVDFSWCLRNGWPKCHGYTMTLVRHDEGAIEQAVGDAFAVIREVKP